MESLNANGTTGAGVAIIGMAGRFPGARDLDEFWNNLANGVESVCFFTAGELAEAGVSAAVLSDPRYVKAAPVLDGVDLFDAAFFDCSPREARLIDPQHRLFLECSWEALENAGYDPMNMAVPVGVYGGAGGLVSSYLLCHAGDSAALVGPTGSLAHISNDKDFLTTRVSYKLNLRGPSVNVQSACSTSLVAVHIACQSLLSHECDMALAGGVSVRVPQKAGYFYDEGGILSPDGHCRAFDASAQGTIFGSGVGIVVLKRLADALADGDPIRAIIKGSAINNDGGSKLSFTAASEAGQTRAIAEALALAEFDPETVTLIEAHGTATALGDPVEISALTKVFRDGTRKTGFCAVGSVKTNIGHAEAAAGIAGLIKAALALEHRQIPASLHWQKSNPRIDFLSSPFFVSTRLQEWLPGKGPRRAGVNSLGIGGTNAFVALEEAAPPPIRPEDSGRAVFCMSAKSPSALCQLAQRYVQHFDRFPELSLSDVCYTTQVGRTPLGERLAVLAGSLAELRQKLAGFATGAKVPETFHGQAAAEPFSGPVLSPGQQAHDADNIEKYAALWAQGDVVDWSVPASNGRPRRTALPTYPFQRERYWVATDSRREASSPSAAPAAPQALLPGRRLQSPLRDIQFECLLGVPIWPQLGEHRVFGEVIVPGAWHLAMILAGARQAFGTNAVTLREIIFPRALSLAKEELRTVQLVFTPAGAGASFQVWSLAPKSLWQLHAQGNVVANDNRPCAVMVDTLQGVEPCSTEMLDQAQFYERMSIRQIDLGPSFQWNASVAYCDDKIVSRLRRPVPDADGFILHPGLIDACIQAMISRLDPTYLPLSIEECRFWPAAASPPSLLQARFRGMEHPQPEVVTGDVCLFDEAGGPILEMKGLGLKRASRAQVQMGSKAEGEGLPVPECQSVQLQIAGRGVLDNLRTNPVPRHLPACGEVEIQVRAAGLNFRDVLNALGTYPGDAGALGLECAGVISAVGPDVHDFKIGDEVLAVAPGSMGTFATTRAVLVREKPAHLSFEQAASIPVAFLSAHHALNHLAGISRGQ
ncbi:MAG TPA: beta-ketoacyl synthase N-terminal-like domain-containing protein, partial [Gemmataceae bacterium]|nr:beta-ketoacyl synthase N-terminal-like domain-containing protein [Gemmataceae bacterium]